MLDPVPELELHEPSHRYRWRGEWLAHNVSDVLNVDMTPFKRAMIDKYKDGPDGWAARVLPTPVGMARPVTPEHHAIRDAS